MDRKRFIKNSGIGLGIALMPGVLLSQPNLFSTPHVSLNDPKVVKDDDGDVLNVIGDIQTHKLLGKDTIKLWNGWIMLLQV